MEKLRVIVDVEFVEEGRTNIQVLQPLSQEQLTNQDMARILSGGLALCIRSCENDSEVMEEMMDYLQKEFVNTDFQIGKYGTRG
jgi:hypothetical protein